MTKRLTKYAPMLVFCVFIAVCFAINLVKPDREQSERENRLLAQSPELTVESFFSGDFMADFETYLVDQFFARDAWVSLKTYAEDDPERALRRARELAGPEGTVLCAGSLYLIGEIRSLLRKEKEFSHVI